jgi:uncharacterized membrane protein
MGMDIIEIIFEFVACTITIIIPGVLLTFVFFNKSALDFIERVAYGFGLSVIAISSFTLLLGLFGIKLTFVLIVIELIVITSLASLVIVLKGLSRGKTKKS